MDGEVGILIRGLKLSQVALVWSKGITNRLPKYPVGRAWSIASQRIRSHLNRVLFCWKLRFSFRFGRYFVLILLYGNWRAPTSMKPILKRFLNRSSWWNVIVSSFYVKNTTYSIFNTIRVKLKNVTNFNSISFISIFQ